MERRDGNTFTGFGDFPAHRLLGRTPRKAEPEPESLAVTSVYLVLRGDPNEGYDPVGLYTSPERAAECVRELCEEFDNDPARELKWGQVKVTEYAVEDGAFVGGGELTAEALGL
jgi:hypothetical protein